MPRPGEFVRAQALMSALRSAWSPTQKPFRFGTAYFNERFPYQWDLNYLDVLRETEKVTAEQLAAEANSIQGAAGLEHRRVTTDYGSGTRLQEGFSRMGWIWDRLVVMSGRDKPNAAVTGDAVELDWTAMRSMREAAFRAEPYGRREEVAASLLKGVEFMNQVAGARHFGAVVDGRVVSACDLFIDGSTAQIEDVYTLDAYRGRGLAQQTMALATRAAHEAECDLVFLVADDEDWPKQIYRKLGFQPSGWTYNFMLSDAHPKAAASG
jgi:GNAT superfamily N-acetyltransferase